MKQSNPSRAEIIDTTGFFDTSGIRNELKARSLRGGAFTMSSHLIRLVSMMFLARLVSKSDHGLFAMMFVVVEFVGMFKDMGLSLATVQQEKITHEQVSVLFWIGLCLSLVTAVVLVAISPVVVWFYGREELYWPIIVLAGGFVLSGLGTQHLALLQRQMCFGKISAINISAFMVGSVVAIVSAFQGAGLWALVLMQLTNMVMISLGGWIFCSWRPGLAVRGTSIRSLVTFGGNLTLFNFVHYATTRLDVLLIARFCGAAPVGIYSRAYNLLLFPLNQINVPVGNVAIPALSRLMDEPERYREVYFRILNRITLVTIPAVAWMIVNSDWIVRVVLGPGWEEAEQIFAILGFAGLMIPIGNTIGWLFVTQNRTAEMLRWGFVDSTILIGSTALGIQWGLIGVTVAVGMRQFLILPLCIWFACRRGPIRAADYLSNLQMPMLMFGVVFLVLTLLRYSQWIGNPIIGLIVTGAMTGLVSLALLGSQAKGRSLLLSLKEELCFLLLRKGV